MVLNHWAYPPTEKEPEPTSYGRWWEFNSLEAAELLVIETNQI